MFSTSPRNPDIRVIVKTRSIQHVARNQDIYVIPPSGGVPKASDRKPAENHWYGRWHNPCITIRHNDRLPDRRLPRPP